MSSSRLPQQGTSVRSVSSGTTDHRSTSTQAARLATAARRQSSFHIDDGHAAESLPLPAAMQATDLNGRMFSRLSKINFLFSVETLIGQIYLNLLLRLPSHYFTRVATIYENAEVSILDMNGIIAWVKRGRHRRDDDRPPLAYEKIKKSWESLIDSLLREWETVNIVAALLLSAILTILQIDQAASYGITRYTAFMSMVCALMSLLYGCMFLVRFGSMKKTSQSVQLAFLWVEEASQRRVPIWWNVWVMLAMPATFLCWALISFITCIMSFMWHSALQQNQVDSALPLKMALSPCVFISFVLGLGLLYLFLIIKRFQRWGETLDRRSTDSWHSQSSVLRTAYRHSLERQAIYPLGDDSVGPVRNLARSEEIALHAVDTGDVQSMPGPGQP